MWGCHPPADLGILSLVVPWIEPVGLLNTAMEPIRAYAIGDNKVSLRLLRETLNIRDFHP
jgi:hypothetical protein